MTTVTYSTSRYHARLRLYGIQYQVRLHILQRVKLNIEMRSAFHAMAVIFEKAVLVLVRRKVLSFPNSGEVSESKDFSDLGDM